MAIKKVTKTGHKVITISGEQTIDGSIFPPPVGDVFYGQFLASSKVPVVGYVSRYSADSWGGYALTRVLENGEFRSQYFAGSDVTGNLHTIGVVGNHVITSNLQLSGDYTTTPGYEFWELVNGGNSDPVETGPGIYGALPAPVTSVYNVYPNIFEVPKESESDLFGAGTLIKTSQGWGAAEYCLVVLRGSEGESSSAASIYPAFVNDTGDDVVVSYANDDGSFSTLSASGRPLRLFVWRKGAGGMEPWPPTDFDYDVFDIELSDPNDQAILNDNWLGENMSADAQGFVVGLENLVFCFNKDMTEYYTVSLNTTEQITYLYAHRDMDGIERFMYATDNSGTGYLVTPKVGQLTALPEYAVIRLPGFPSK